MFVFELSILRIWARGGGDVLHGSLSMGSELVFTQGSEKINTKTLNDYADGCDWVPVQRLLSTNFESRNSQPLAGPKIFVIVNILRFSSE